MHANNDFLGSLGSNLDSVSSGAVTIDPIGTSGSGHVIAEHEEFGIIDQILTKRERDEDDEDDDDDDDRLRQSWKREGI